MLPFDKMVIRDVSSMEAAAGTKLPENILAPEQLREMSVTSLRVYKQLKDEKMELPSLEKMSYKDFLPNSLARKQARSVKA
mmetsp:Transcript_22959/g.35415  ORF Transcript_22959/g.35415 Transcript_22959/m.35415 type:complete len:81 (-) Transcript_22959:1-243(-)